jgi:hypothetical protein
MNDSNENPAAHGDAQAGVDDVVSLAGNGSRIPQNHPVPQPLIANNPLAVRNTRAAGRRDRLQYLARRLHGLGERPLFHFLDEFERGADLRPHLERYAALPAAFIKANGGDRFVPALHVIDGGKR